MELSHPILINFYASFIAFMVALFDFLMIRENINLSKAYHIIKFWALVALATAVYFTTDTIHNPIEILAAMASYWIVFDITLNLLRGKKINYIPKNPDSWIERKFKTKDGYRYMAYKFLICFSLSVTAHLIG